MSDNGYDADAIELLKGLQPPRRRRPWDGLMYDPTDSAQVAALRQMMEHYMRENPDENLSGQIANLGPANGEKGNGAQDD